MSSTLTIDTCLNTDSLKWMDEYQGQPFADLVFADPPFNIGWKYNTYDDEQPEDDFIDWNRRWINLAISKVLKPFGQIYICMGDEYVADICQICKRELKLTMQNWLVWHYTFGQSGKLDHRKRFTRSKTHILRFSVHPRKFYFDPISVAVPSGRLLEYADKRADPRGKCPDDVFITKRIAGTHKDRFPGMSTQMSEDLVKPWIIATTKAGDTIYDPFPGSGVSMVVAKKTGRHFFATELDTDYHSRILNRLNVLPHSNIQSPCPPTQPLHSEQSSSDQNQCPQS